MRKMMESMASFRSRAQAALIDVRYGGRILRGSLKTSNAHLGAHDIVHTKYEVLEVLFRGRVKDGDVLVDVGCGKGRVLNFWLRHYAHHKIYGIELESSVASQTAKRLRNYSNVKIVSGDACELLPDEGSLIYLYNPFNSEVMKRFMNKLSSGTPNRRVIYYNCACVDMFRSDPRFAVQDIDIKPARNQPPCALIEVMDVSRTSRCTQEV